MRSKRRAPTPPNLPLSSSNCSPARRHLPPPSPPTPRLVPPLRHRLRSRQLLWLPHQNVAGATSNNGVRGVVEQREVETVTNHQRPHFGDHLALRRCLHEILLSECAAALRELGHQPAKSHRPHHRVGRQLRVRRPLLELRELLLEQPIICIEPLFNQG